MRLSWEDEAWADYLYWQDEKYGGIIIVSCRGHYDD